MNQQSNFLEEIIVDHFCGGGGASTGIEFALGRTVDIAVNHDPAAIGMHEINHKWTKHYLKNVFEVDPLEAVAGRPVGLMWLSPDCTHFSRAKGGTPVKKEIRGLAWLALKWASAVRPRVIVLENVPEFQTWGPLDKNGKPMKPLAGKTFKQFVANLRNLGYAVDWRVLDASDYGAGTSRKRLYLIARCDGNHIVFPKPTHGDRKGLLPKKVAADFIDFSERGKSIFGRKKPLATATLRRIARGLDKFTIKNKKPFITQIQFNNEPQDAASPLSTICGTNKHNVVSPVYSPFIANMQFNNLGQPADKPIQTQTTGTKDYVVVPRTVRMPFISARYGDNGLTNARGREVTEPLPVITAQGDHNELMAANLIQYHSEMNDREARAYGLEEPIKVIDTNPRYGLSSANLINYYNTGTALDIQKPLPTATTKDRMAVISTHLAKYPPEADMKRWAEVRSLLNEFAGYSLADDEVIIIEIDGAQYFIGDIEMRMLMPKELYGCQGFPSDYNFEQALIDGEVVKLSKTEQVKKVGNSVCPPVATALVRANLEVATAKPINTMQQLNRLVAL